MVYKRAHAYLSSVKLFQKNKEESLKKDRLRKVQKGARQESDMQEFDLMKEVERLRAQLDQKQQEVETFKARDFNLT